MTPAKTCVGCGSPYSRFTGSSPFSAKLIDKRSDSLGIPQQITRLRAEKAPAERVHRAIDAWAKLNSEMPDLKEYRDKRLSHIGAEELSFRAMPPVQPAIIAAVEAVDEIAGVRNGYKNIDVDLRQAVLGDAPPANE
jgi:hypothetical protein